jgi:hypothetical protein
MERTFLVSFHFKFSFLLDALSIPKHLGIIDVPLPCACMRKTRFLVRFRWDLGALKRASKQASKNLLPVPYADMRIDVPRCM